MSKDERWNIHLLVLVHNYWDALTIVHDLNSVFLLIDVNFNRTHLCVALLVVCKS